MAENTWSPTKDPTIKGHYSYFVGWIRFYPIKYPDYIPGLFLIEHQKQYSDTIKPPLKSLNITKTHDIPMNLPFISHSYTYSGKIKDVGIESHEIRCFSWLPSPCFTMKPGIAKASRHQATARICTVSQKSAAVGTSMQWEISRIRKWELR